MNPDAFTTFIRPPFGVIEAKQEVHDWRTWSVGDFVTVGGLIAAGFMWLWRKPIKAILTAIIDILLAPGRIREIDKRMATAASQSELALAISRIHWRMMDKIIWQSDALGKCVYCNPFMLRILARQDEEILGDSWRTIIAEDDREKVQREWDKCIAQNRDFRLSYNLLTTAGEKVPVIANASRLLDYEGRVMGWVGFASIVDPFDKPRLPL